MAIQVKYAKTDAEKEMAYKLRYQIFVEEVGAHFDHITDRRIVDPSDETGRILLAFDEDKPIGTLRICWGGDAPFENYLEGIYQLSRFSSIVTDEQIVVFERFVVAPEYRGTPAPFQLLAAISLFSLENGVQLAFCDCQPHHLNLYLGLGFRTYAPTFNYGVLGILIPLVFVCEDLDHLRRIRSPLLAFQGNYPFDSGVPEKIKPILSQAESPVESATQDSAARWIEAYGLVSKSGTTDIAMFEGLNEDDVSKLLKKSHIIDCVSGDKVILSGKSDRTIFVILEGTVEIRSGDQITGVRTEGDVVGELSFLLDGPRNADVVAASDTVRILSLREQTIRQLQKNEPALGAQLMYNLARIVAVKMVSLYQRVLA